MNIDELEKRTGVAKQNIRFYEKKGLLHPERNEENNYRKYKEEDVRTLQIVKILRKLDMPIEDIHKVIDEELPLAMALDRHLDVLVERQEELEASIGVCRSLMNESLMTLDTDKVLEKMDEMERKGGVFMSIIDDYKKVCGEESMKKFTFMPNTMVKNPKEFTQALLEFAEENNRHLIIKKEGMYPVFELDGVEYTAERIFGRFGAVVHCSMTHPELVEAKDVSGFRRKVFRIIGRYWGIVFLALFIVLSRLPDWRGGLLVCIFLLPFVIWLFRLTSRLRN